MFYTNEMITVNFSWLLISFWLIESYSFFEFKKLIINNLSNLKCTN